MVEILVNKLQLNNILKKNCILYVCANLHIIFNNISNITSIIVLIYNHLQIYTNLVSYKIHYVALKVISRNLLLSIIL